MFKILLIKEIQTALIDFRFWIVLVLCLSIIPLSFYVSSKNYEQQLADYQHEVQSYKDKWAGNLFVNFNAEGVRTPSPLSIFSQGLDNKIPYKVITSRDGQYTIEYSKPSRKEDLLGKIDFAFIVSFILSILAISFTFSSISGDKENGLFKAVLSNPILRREILLSKLIGSYLVFLVPFILSIFVGLLIVHFIGVIPIFSAKLFPFVLIMTGISMLFIFAMFNLGLWISALTRSSILSINTLLLIWILIGLVIPKVSPIIAETIYPVESNNIFEVNKAMVRSAIIKEQNDAEIDLYEEIRARLKPNSQGVSSDWEDLNNEYDEKVIPIREKYEKQLAVETDKIIKDYASRCDKQNQTARLISSLSPINSVNNLMAEYSATGYSEINNFMTQAKLYQENIEQIQYNKLNYKIYQSRGGTVSNVYSSENFDPRTAPVPIMENYKHVNLTQATVQNWGDIVLLLAYSLLFFILAFVSFIRFDVR